MESGGILEHRDDLGDGFVVGDQVGQGIEASGEEARGDELERELVELVHDDHRLGLLGELEGDGARDHEGEVAPAGDEVGFPDADVEPFGPPAEHVRALVERLADLFCCCGNDTRNPAAGVALELLVQLAEGSEEDGEVAPDLGGAGAGEDCDFVRGLGEACGFVGEGVQVDGFVEEGVPDEAGVHALRFEPWFLEWEEAEDEVGAFAELFDAPGAPRPELGRDEVDDFAIGAFGDPADGEVGGGGIDGDMEDDFGVVGEPAGDVFVDALVLADFFPAGDADDGVVPGFVDDGGARGAHFRAAPGEDGEVRVASFEFADDDGGVVIARGLEGGEEDGGIVVHCDTQADRGGVVNRSGGSIFGGWVYSSLAGRERGFWRGGSNLSLVMSGTERQA